ncbi:MAG TPA: hypothetical protein PLU30_22625, partial [Verrucomicrobiae bacterium]|nr:hypothetical protein [Verrucomicrobiae bacterium]
TWSPLGGMNDAVRALAVSGTNLYAGGWFTTAGGIGASRIAKWNGTWWSALNGGVTGFEPYVGALAVAGSNVYAGGSFVTAGGIGATNIAMWNGTSWSALGSGMNSMVSALAVSGNDLYAGGDFTTAGGNPANFVAKWNGTSWSALGSGTSDMMYALVISGTDLYAGGRFATAGGKVSAFVAKANVITASESWRFQYFGTMANSGSAADGADPDGDGVKNLEEFAFGLHPWRADLAALPLPTRNGNNLTVTFTQPSSVSGIIYGAEVSTDLVHWDSVSDTGGGTTHTFTYPVGSNHKLFMRLKVTEP